MNKFYKYTVAVPIYAKLKNKCTAFEVRMWFIFNLEKLKLFTSDDAT
jgi:hypothetical protein